MHSSIIFTYYYYNYVLIILVARIFIVTCTYLYLYLRINNHALQVIADLNTKIKVLTICVNYLNWF